MLRIGTEFLDFSAPYRRRFGLRGLGLAVSLRDWRRPVGQKFQVHVPGFRSPVLLRAGTADRLVLDQILVYQELNFTLPSAPRLIIDGGANIGLSSVYFATRYPGATIIALEIEEGNFEVLLHNVASYTSIVPLRKGLWSRRGKLQVANPKDETWAFQARTADGSTEGVVDAVGVRDLIDEYGPIDLLKMDIEGGEFEVLSENPASWIDEVGTLAVELHDRFRPGCRDALTAAVSRIEFDERRHGEYVVLSRRERFRES